MLRYYCNTTEKTNQIERKYFESGIGVMAVGIEIRNEMLQTLQKRIRGFATCWREEMKVNIYSVFGPRQLNWDILWGDRDEKRGPLFFSFFLSFYFYFFAFLGVHLQHIEVPRLGAESELQLLAYTIAIPTEDPSCICVLHHRIEPTSSWIVVRFVSTVPQQKLLILNTEG